jgi:hypothetical protein
MKLQQKAIGLVGSDGNTPIIGPFCKKVLTLCEGLNLKDVEQVKPYNMRFALDEQYPNEYGEWMLAYAFGCDLNIDVFEQWLDSVTVATALLSPPLIAEPKTHKVESTLPSKVYVNDEIVEVQKAEVAPIVAPPRNSRERRAANRAEKAATPQLQVWKKKETEQPAAKQVWRVKSKPQ